MVVKGIIKSIDYNGNSCTVRMPYFETAGSDEIICTALISNVPGVYNGYKENDVVWVGFEDGMIETPVIMGKLYLGAATEKLDPRGTVNVISSNVTQEASIPFDTKLSNTIEEKDLNTKAQYRSLESLSATVNEIAIDYGQNDRDLGNKIRSVVDIVGPNGEKIYSLIEQTAYEIKNEVVCKHAADEIGFTPEEKFGWDLTLNGWNIYSELDTLAKLELNTILSFKKVTEDDVVKDTLFINNTETNLTVEDICKSVVLELICNPSGAGYNPDTNTYEFEVSNSATQTLPVTEFLEQYLGQSHTKTVFGNEAESNINLTYYDSLNRVGAPRSEIELNLVKYESNISTINTNNIREGWNVFIDIAEFGHTLNYQIKYYILNDNDQLIEDPTKTIYGKINAKIIFYGEDDITVRQDPNRCWSVVTYYALHDTNKFCAPIKLTRSEIKDKTNTLLGVDRNGLYVNGTITAQSGHIGEFIIGKTHECSALGGDLASGIYSENYIKRFEDEPAAEQKGVYVGTDGIKLGDSFSISPDGTIKASKLLINPSQVDGLDLDVETVIRNTDVTAQNLKVEFANVQNVVTKKIEVTDSSTRVFYADIDHPADTEIGGFKVSTNSLHTTGKSSIDDISDGVYIGSSGIRLGEKFKVDNQGNVTATGLEASKIHVKDGDDTLLYANTSDPTNTQIGGFYVRANKLISTDNSVQLSNEGLTVQGDATKISITNSNGYGELVMTSNFTYSELSFVGNLNYLNGGNGAGFMWSSYEYTRSNGVSVSIIDDGGSRYEFTFVFRQALQSDKTFTIHAYGHNSGGSAGSIHVAKSITVNAGFSIYTTDPFGFGFGEIDWWSLEECSSAVQAEHTAQFEEVMPTNNTQSIGNFIPATPLNVVTSSLTLGSANAYWHGIYGEDFYNMNGPIIFSDINKKTDIDYNLDKYEAVFDEFRPVTFKYTNGTSNRIHMGLIAQDVKSAVINNKLSIDLFAPYCSWKDANNNDTCGLRYEEFIALNIDQIQKLKKRMAELENKLSKLEKGE